MDNADDKNASKGRKCLLFVDDLYWKGLHASCDEDCSEINEKLVLLLRKRMELEKGFLSVPSQNFCYPSICSV